MSDATPPLSAPRLHYGWIVLAMATFVVFGALGLGRFGYTAVLPAMQQGLGFDNTRAGLLASVNLAGYLLLAAVSGALASHIGPRRVIAVGLAVAGAGMVLTGFAGTLAAAALWRFVTGMGSGAGNVPVMGLIPAWFAPRRRGLATGVGVAGSSIALIVVGPLVPAFMAWFGPDGWRQCWFLFGATTLVLALLAWAVLRDRPAERGLTAVGAAALAPGTAPAKDAARWSHVYRAGRVWHLGLIYFAFGFAYIIYLTFFVKRLVADAGYGRDEAGRLFALLGWGSLFCGVLWGAISDRVGRRAALAAVYVIQALAMAGFALARGPAAFVASACAFGITAWSVPAIMAALCGDLLGARLAPAALGFVTLFFGIGQALAPSVAGAVADAAGSFAPAYLVAAGVALLGALGSLALSPDPNSQS